MKREIITAIAISLFSIGVVSGVLIAFNYFSSPHVISNERAIAIAIKSGQWTQPELNGTTIDAKLLQAKLSNRIALIINDTTMSAGTSPKVVPLPPIDVHEDQLFWDVLIRKHLRGAEYKEWEYDIDATDGTILKKW